MLFNLFKKIVNIRFLFCLLLLVIAVPSALAKQDVYARVCLLNLNAIDEKICGSGCYPPCTNLTGFAGTTNTMTVNLNQQLSVCDTDGNNNGNFTASEAGRYSVFWGSVKLYDSSCN